MIAKCRCFSMGIRVSHARFFLRLLLCLILFLDKVEPLSARDYPMLHYTIEDGLPSNTIYQVYETPDGKLWIGTDKGVSVFNGISFQNYTTDDGLSDNECFHFYRDTLDRLWIGTFNGELCYYQDGKFHNAQNTPWLKRPFRASNTYLFQPNADGSFLVFYREAGFLEIKGEHIKSFTYPLPGTENALVEKLSSNDYGIYGLSEPHIPKLASIIHIDSNSVVFSKKYLPHDLYSTIVINLHGRLEYMLVSYTYNVFYDKNGDFIYPQLRQLLGESTTNQIFDNGRHILVSTNGGLLKDNEEWLLRNKTVHFVFEDKVGNYWIGTKEGLYKLSERNLKATVWPSVYKYQPIYAYTSANYLFWGTRAKEVCRTAKSGAQQLEVLSKGSPNLKYNYLFSAVIGGNYYIFGEPYYWIIAHINHPTAYYIESREIKNRAIFLRNVFCIDSNVYFCTRAGIVVQELQDLLHNRYISIKKQTNHNRHVYYAFAVSPDQHLWCSTVDQVYRLEDITPVAQRQFGKVAFRESLFVGDYYVGISHTNQLLVCHDYESTAIYVDTIRPFRSCVWNKLYKVNDSTVLLSTNNYFRLLHLPTRSDSSCHLRVVENPFIPYQPDYVHLDSSDCYFFKGGDITSYPLSTLLAPEALPHVVFDRLYTLADTLQISDTLCLSYDRAQNLKISFSPVSFDHKQLTYEYAFCHPGESLRWQSLESEELSVLRMGYGVFEVHVRALTLSGDYSEDSHFVLIVSRPFWARWWFIGLLTLLFLFLVVYVAPLGIKRNLRRKEQEVRFLRSEYKALNALMNPHFIFNSLNSLQSLVNNYEVHTASQYIRTFSDLIRQNMSNVSQELISLSKEILLVENYLKIEQLRFKEKLSYEIAVEESVEADLIMIPPLLIQPMVENAIKHGVLPKRSVDGFISIQVYEEDGLLYISIRDNGQGLREGGKDSYALGNIRKRIAHLEQIHSIRIEVRIENLLDEDGEVSGVLSLIIIGGV